MLSKRNGEAKVLKIFKALGKGKSGNLEDPELRNLLTKLKVPKRMLGGKQKVSDVEGETIKALRMLIMDHAHTTDSQEVSFDVFKKWIVGKKNTRTGVIPEPPRETLPTASDSVNSKVSEKIQSEPTSTKDVPIANSERKISKNDLKILQKGDPSSKPY